MEHCETLAWKRTEVNIEEGIDPRSLQVHIRCEGTFDRSEQCSAKRWTGSLALAPGDIEAIGRAWFRSKSRVPAVSSSSNDNPLTPALSSRFDFSPRMDHLTEEELAEVERQVMEQRHEAILRASTNCLTPPAHSPCISRPGDETNVDTSESVHTPFPTETFQQRPFYLLAHMPLSRSSSCEESTHRLSEDSDDKAGRYLRSPARIHCSTPYTTSKASKSAVYLARRDGRSPGAACSSLSELQRSA
jgi:hypothetical protein